MLEQRQLDILEHADPPQERGTLEDDADAGAKRAQFAIVRHGGIESMSIDGDESGLRPLQPNEVPHEHRLPGLNGTEHEQRFAARDEQIDVEDEGRARRTREVPNLQRPLRGRGRG